MDVIFCRIAAKALHRSDKAALIRAKIAQLAADPASVANNVTKLVDRSGYRLRVQDWRVIFRIEDETLFIEDIGPCGGIY